VNVIVCNVDVDVMMKHVWHGKASHTQARQVTVVTGSVVTTTLCIVSAADGSCTPHCRLRQRFDSSVLKLTGLSWVIRISLLCNIGVTVVWRIRGNHQNCSMLHCILQ